LRPIVAEYQQLVALLAKGRRTGLGQRLGRVKSLRAQIVARMNKVDDYMNWFEATQARTGSGVFADYLNAAEKNENTPRRRDALSVYLDSVAGQFQD
jgi:5'-deoxynucleotidase YfbR-like HD superfamily hydrolase